MSTTSSSRIPRTVSTYIDRHFPRGTGAILLAGDASTRTYFRILPGDGSPSQVLAVHGPDLGLRPFRESTDLFTAIGLPVPAILDEEMHARLLLLEDLGDRTLQGAMDAKRVRPDDGSDAVLLEAQVDRFYVQAVEWIVVIQRRGTPRLHAGTHAGKHPLDAARLRFELDFCFEHLVLGLRQAQPSDEQKQAVGKAFDGLCSQLAGEPKRLCHRDYHSRNLMVTPAGELRLIDHQDARLGPDTYDLASLLFDPYVPVPSERLDRMIGVYLTAAGSHEDPGDLRRRLDRMAVQRLLKAAGTYASQKTLRNQDTYLRYLPRTLQRAADCLRRSPDLAPLQQALAPLLEELRG